MPGGRPLKFETPEKLEEKINEYFGVCDQGEDVEELSKRGELVKYRRKIPYTIEGLSLHLDCDPSTIRRYGKRDEFRPIITRARTKIVRSWINGGLSGQFNPKIVALCLAANYKPYNVTRQHEVATTTYEQKLAMISERRKMLEDMREKEQIPEAEIVE